MATNVFGDLITDETLRERSEYATRTITCIDRAHVAFNSKDEENRRPRALHYVDNLRRERGTGICTRCLVYNATGDPVSFVISNDYDGELGRAPYPKEIANGQWGAFLHVGKDNNSTAAAVYRGENQAGQKCDFMLAWYNLWHEASSHNKVYTEIREGGHFEKWSIPSVWSVIMENMRHHELKDDDEWDGCWSTVKTERGTSPLFEAIITRKSDDAAA